MQKESKLSPEGPEILFENDELLVCVKPRGVLSAKDASGKRNMADLLLPREIFPVHRLDRDVTGLMVFAKTKSAAAFFSGQLTDGFSKEYLALCEGNPEEDGELFDLLYHDRIRNKTYVVKRQRAGVKDARLSYHVLYREQTHSLVQIHLHTGRTHQIRVQFASRGFPLLGDRKYGGKGGCELQLFAYRLTFSLPSEGGLKTFTLPERYLPEGILSACKTNGIVL